MSFRKEASIFLYIGLLVGMGFLGAYLWIILAVVLTYDLFHFMLLMTGVLLVLSTLGIAYTKTRSGRTGLTILSGILGGIHAYLDLALFPGIGIIMFAWIALALLLCFSAFAWLQE